MTDISEEQVIALQEKLLDAITDRKGWRHEWDNFDEEIRNDIIAEHREIIRAALSAALPQWRTIETAPKDGNPILLFWQDSENEDWMVDVCFWDADFCGEGAWVLQESSIARARWCYTHWQPLPPPPASTEGKQATTPTSF